MGQNVSCIKESDTSHIFSNEDKPPKKFNKHLESLTLKNLCVKKLSIFPSQLRCLNIYNLPFLKILPELPNTLEYLVCNKTSISIFPKLPESLITLRSRQNYKIKTLISKENNLPENLIRLDCSECMDLISLPILPKKLKFLTCTMCIRLESIPNIPNSLEILKCDSCLSLKSILNPPDYTQVDFIGYLDGNDTQYFHYVIDDNFFGSRVEEKTYHKNLQELDCSMCGNLQLLPHYLPAFILNCSGCYSLRKLPNLSSTLGYLNCSSCPITMLPELPTCLKELKCANCPIVYLSKLSHYLSFLDISGTLLSSPPMENVFPSPQKYYFAENCNFRKPEDYKLISKIMEDFFPKDLCGIIIQY